MMQAQTTLKVTGLEHQTLVALLRRVAGKITGEQFMAVMVSQGRAVESLGDKDVQKFIAESLIGPFS